MQHLADFPDRWLRPRTASMWPSSAPRDDCPAEAQVWDFEIPLEPFDLGELIGGGEADPCETSFRFDAMCLAARSAIHLVGSEIRFPINPQPGYVDGSIYLQLIHHPVDVLAVRFGEIHDREIAASFEIQIRFEFEGSDFRDRPATITMQVRLPEELSSVSGPQPTRPRPVQSAP